MVRALIKQKIRGAKQDNFQEVLFELEYNPPFPPVSGMGVRAALTTFSTVVTAVQYVIAEDLYICFTDPLLLGPQDPPMAQIISEFEVSGYRRGN